MKSKFRKEQYILQICSNATESWSFQVRIRLDDLDISKTFSERRYGTAKTAFDQAVIFRDRKLKEYRSGLVETEKRITLEQCFYESLDLFNLRYKTRRNHIAMYRKFIHSDMLLKDLNNAYAMKCMNKMTETCTDDRIQRAYSIFKDIDRTALYNNYYKSSHITYLKPPQSHKIQSFSDERITDKQTLIKVISLLQGELCDPYEKQQIPNILWTLYYTGCRPGEIFALNKKDVKNGWIYINKEIGSSADDENVLRPPKNKASYRKIPIAKELSQILENAAALHDREILFPDRNGRYYYSNLLTSKISHIIKRTGIKFSCYMLRHLFQTDLRYSGVDDKTIDVLVGHSNKKTIDIYTHTNDERLKNAIFLRKECVHLSNTDVDSTYDDKNALK